MEETGSEKTSLEETAKVIDQQEYLAKVRELIDGITKAWQVEDRVTSLKLSIKVNLLTYQIWFGTKSCKILKNGQFCSAGHKTSDGHNSFAVLSYSLCCSHGHA